VTVSLGCLWRTLDRLGMRLKKSRFVPPSRTLLAFAAFDSIPISTGGGPNEGMDTPPRSDQS